jgi:ethanolaminephosphotransferase
MLGLSTISVGAIFGAGWNVTFWFLFLTYIPFFMQTWEEFHRKELILPVINGPSEGILIIVSMMLFSWFVGGSWWHQVKVFVQIT